MKLGLVVPTYGRTPSTLGRTLASLVAPDPENLDVLVVDQNVGPARNAIEDVARQNGASYRWLDAPNVSRARNLGAIALDTDLIGFIDDDVVLAPAAIGRAIELFRRRLDIGCVWASVVDEGAAARNSSGEQGSIQRVQHIRSDALFFRAETFRLSGGFDPHIFDYARAVEDHELFLRLTRYRIFVWLAPDIQAIHYPAERGGCDLRSVPLIENERRCIAGLAYAERAQRCGHLGLPAVCRLLRAFILNRGIVQRPIPGTFRRLGQFCDAVSGSRRAIAPHLPVYADLAAVNHLTSEKVFLES